VVTPRAERGQGSVEFVGLLPLVLVVALGMAQMLAVGYSSVLAGNAAEAGALAMAAGGDVAAGARQSLPGWSRARARVDSGRGRVSVRLRPPSPLRLVSRKLEVHAEAAVNAP
jgi:pilus assembly protein CpaE